MPPQTSTIDPLLSFSNVHTLSIHVLLSLFKRSPSSIKSVEESNVTMATISPAHTTTQLLVHNTSPTPNFISAQEMLDLSTIPEPSIGCHLQLLKRTFPNVNNIKNEKKLLPLQSSASSISFSPSSSTTSSSFPVSGAALQNKPSWSQSHAYIRGLRTNTDTLRILTAESGMIRASKITGPLKPRRPYAPKRQDDFVWGRPSKLRNSSLSFE